MKQDVFDSFSKGSGLNQEGFIPIGGIEQWISIQGTDSNNPVILFLHGGPGEAQSPFLHEFLPWEKAFTVINWDQRGSGKTFGKNGDNTPGMTIERMTQDVIELAGIICERLNQSKLILIGHSWGSWLGLYVIKREPELFHAFVGTGQAISWQRIILDRESWTRKRAIEENDEQTLKQLDETGVLPINDMRRVMASNKYRMSPSDIEYIKVMEKFTGQPPFLSREHMEEDVADWIAGSSFTISKLASEITSIDARTLGLDIPLPFFVIQGRDDHTTSFETARVFTEEIRAPKKAFVPIEGGHFACFTNPQEFVAALIKYITPLAKKRG